MPINSRSSSLQVAQPLDQIFAFGAFALNPGLKILTEDGKPVYVGIRTFDLLFALVESAGQVLSKTELASRIWPDEPSQEGSLRSYISILRKILGDGQNGARFISNVAGRGYCFVADVRRMHMTSVAVADGPKSTNPTNLPMSLTKMIGRSELLHSIGHSAAERRLVSIVGPGGVGKTTLALAIAEAQLPQFPHGVWLVDLSTVSDAEKVYSVLAAALDAPAGSADSIQSLSLFLHDKKAMILFDNCEHMLDAVSSTIGELLRQADEVHILTTSRESLRMSGEYVHRLRPLESPVNSLNLSVTNALEYSAVQLFVERAIASVDSFAVTGDNVAYVADICKRLDGIPLAIELAAARIDAYGVRGLYLQLEDRIGLLSHVRRGVASRHRTLRAMIAWSYEGLPEEQQILMRRLAVFAGSFDIEAAVAVAQEAPLDAKKVVLGVAGLATKSLLASDTVAERITYRMLFSTRAFALERLEKDPDRRDTLSRHVTFMVTLLAGAEIDGAPLSRAEWLAAYGRAIDDVRIALAWALSDDGNFAAGVRLVSTSVSLGHALSLYNEFSGYVKQAISHLPSICNIEPAVVMRLHGALAALSAFTDGYTKLMISQFDQAYQAVAGSGDRYEVEALNGLWISMNTQGDHQAAARHALRIVEIARSTDDPAFALVGNRLLATSEHHLGHHSTAAARIDRLLLGPLPQPRLGPPFPVDPVIALQTISARIHWIEGRPDEALRLVRDTVKIAAGCSVHALALVLGWGACPIAFWCGELDLAQEFVDLLHQHATKFRLNNWFAHAQNFRQVLAARKRRSSARGDSERISVVVSEFDDLQRDLLQTLDGDVFYVDSLTRVRNRQVSWCTPEVLRLDALEILSGAEAHASERAIEKLIEARSLAQRQGALSWELRAGTSMATIHLHQGKIDAAEDVLLQTYQKFTEGFSTADLVEARVVLGKIGQSRHR